MCAWMGRDGTVGINPRRDGTGQWVLIPRRDGTVQYNDLFFHDGTAR